MKFQHEFVLESFNGHTAVFASKPIHARLDFLSFGVRVSVYHDGDFFFPTFSVCPDGKMPEQGRERLSLQGFEFSSPKMEEKESGYEFSFGPHSIFVEKKNFRLSHYENEKLLFQDREYLSYNLENEFGEGSCHYLSREAGEHIYGLGDKTGDVDRNLRSFRLSEGDAMGFDARSSDPLYKHIPFYLCQNGVGCYGLYYDTYSQGQFDFGREINNYYSPFKSFRCEEGALVYYVFYGTLPEIARNFAWLRGPDFMPPMWTLRYCGSSMEIADAPNAEEKMKEFLSRCEDYDIHPGGFYLSSGYTMKNGKRYVFHWNKDSFPTPEELADEYRKKGVEILPNIKPCFLRDHPLYSLLAEKGYFLTDGHGKPALFPFWGDYGSYLDFTNPDAASFWTECVKKQLVDKGYLNSWNDNNEYDVEDSSTMAYGFGHPIQARLIRPLFSYLMVQASLKAQKDDKRKVAVSRCGIVGTGRLASTWTGDNRTSWDDFRYNHKMAMSMSLSGIFNFGQDIGGFAGPKPDKELFLRWIQYGIFTPRFVLHSWNPDHSSTMPWLYPEEKEKVRALFSLRESLLPYLYQQVYRSTQDFRPIIYPLFLRYPEESPESDGFFFGDDIISWPIFDKGATEANVSLPGEDYEWFYEGKRVKKTGVYRCLPGEKPIYFIHEGTILPLGNGSYQIYAAREGTAKAKFLVDDGSSPLSNGPEYDEICVDFCADFVRIDFKSARKHGFKVIDSDFRPVEVIS